MSQDDLTMLMLGMQVQCTDGSAGVLSGVAIDAPQHRIVDVLVEPRHHHELARWVPVAKVAADGADRTSLQLNLTTDELRQERPAVELDLPPADESAVRLGDTPEDRELAHPYVGFTPVDGGHGGASKRPVAEDHAPEGDVELR